MAKTKKEYRPGNLPFLQAQILQKIYIDLSKDKSTTLRQLSKLTGYPEKSKMLKNAIESLVNKGFLKGSLKQGFEIPENRYDFFEQILRESDYKYKNYTDKLLHGLNQTPTQLDLFYKAKNVSDLNRYGVIHRWYNYLEEFPYSLIEEKIREYNLMKGSLVVDPFVGSGTTLVSANMFQCDGIGFDSNPLMTFISKVKTTWDIDLDQFSKEVKNIAVKFIGTIRTINIDDIQDGFLKRMPKKELNQWLSPILQKEVSYLKKLIMKTKDTKIRNLLLLAMSKSCFDASYVSLCPGTTFYPFRKKEEFWTLFTDKIIQIYDDLKLIQQHNSYGKSELITDSCLNASKYLAQNSIDFVITSPPYPNDLEYTRQTRLELYLLDFVHSMNDIQEIKKSMVKGSTKLLFKGSNSSKYVEDFPEVRIVSDKIYEQTKDKNWGFDYPRMVKEYFGDMFLCMQEFFQLMKKKSHFLLVVGDQTIKGVYIPVCDILINIADKIGYKNCRKELFRMRRSTGHNISLPEEIIILEK